MGPGRISSTACAGPRRLTAAGLEALSAVGGRRDEVVSRLGRAACESGWGGGWPRRRAGRLTGRPRATGKLGGERAGGDRAARMLRVAREGCVRGGGAGGSAARQAGEPGAADVDGSSGRGRRGRYRTALRRLVTSCTHGATMPWGDALLEALPRSTLMPVDRRRRQTVRDVDHTRYLGKPGRD